MIDVIVPRCRATTPVTCGDATDVPDMRKGPDGVIDKTSWPGAQMSGQVPQLLKFRRDVVNVVGIDCDDVGDVCRRDFASVASAFPAATMTGICVSITA